MTYSFSEISKKRLKTCHPQLQMLFEDIIKEHDCSILEGHRTYTKQKQLYAEGKSKVKVSKHNHKPSLAVDVAPYPVDFNNFPPFYNFAKIVLNKAKQLGIKIRWGGDWDMDGDTTDQQFNDLVHFELIL